MKSRPRPSRRSRASQRRTASPTCLLPAGLERVLPVAEHAALAEAVLARPSKAVRLRPAAAAGQAAASPLPFASEPVPWFSQGRFCTDTHQPGRFLAHAAGDYFVQDAGSMLALALLDAQPCEWIADVCAAPGAKASALLEVVGPGGGFLLANEPVRGRLPPLAYNLSRVGFSRWLLTSVDPERFGSLWEACFDAVLVDAPCTGQALVGRGKQSSAAFTAAQVSHSAARQQRIVRAAAALVRPGGRLVYSTCTFAAEENEEVIAHFLQHHQAWQVEDVPSLQPWRSPLPPGGYRLYPHRDRCAGSYAVRLRHTGGSEAGATAPTAAQDKDLQREPLNVGEELIGELAAVSLHRSDARLEAWPADVARVLGRQGERAQAVGSEVAYKPGKHWMPSHALALRRETSWQPRHVHPLNDHQAAAYLQGHPLPAGPNGWCVATWQGRPLGWLRGNPQRLNNGLPPAARLSFSPE